MVSICSTKMAIYYSLSVAVLIMDTQINYILFKIGISLTLSIGRIIPLLVERLYACFLARLMARGMLLDFFFNRGLT